MKNKLSIAILIIIAGLLAWWQFGGVEQKQIPNLSVSDPVAAVQAYVANELSIDERAVIVLSVFEKKWPDSCLGLAGEGELCAQVITAGYEVTVQADGTRLIYRTNEDGSVLRIEP